METISIIPENFVVLLFHPSSLFLPILSSQFLILSLLVLGRHISKIIWYVPFCVWLLLLKNNVSEIHIVAYADSVCF